VQFQGKGRPHAHPDTHNFQFYVYFLESAEGIFSVKVRKNSRKHLFSAHSTQTKHDVYITQDTHTIVCNKCEKTKACNE
jgi:RNase P subunit RPR2